VLPGQHSDVRSVCGRDTWDVDHFVTDGSVLLCRICVEDDAAAIHGAAPEERRVTLAPSVFGSAPDPDAPGAIAHSVAQVVGAEPAGGWGPVLEDAEAIRGALIEAREGRGITGAQAIVRRIRFESDNRAWILLTVHLGPCLGGFPFEGPVKRIDGTWKVGRELVETMLGTIGIHLHPQT
jgi:hypothetical protein